MTTEPIPAPSAQVGANARLQCREGSAELRSKLQGDLDSIVLMALRPEPEARYGSAAALAEDIVRFQNGNPVTARKGTTLYLLSRYARRHGRGLAAAAVVAASLSWASWNEWRVTALRGQMNRVHEEIVLPATEAAGGDRPVVAGEQATAGAVRLDQHIRLLQQNYESTFPRLVDNPFSSRTENRRFVERDLAWLNGVAPLAQREPGLALPVAQSYLDLARAQWTRDGGSLRDAGAAGALAHQAAAVLQGSPEEPADRRAWQAFTAELDGYVCSLPPEARPN